MSATYVITSLSALFFWAAIATAQGNVDGHLTAGMIIDADFTAARGEYVLASNSLDRPAITVRGEGITVDFSGARLIGSDDPARPDLFSGLAVRVEGKNVTIKGLEARGYKVALMARDVAGVTIDDCDFSYNWRQRLQSDPWKENTADWMSYHNNEQDQWLRFGAAVYLRDCDGFAIHGNTVVGGQNALLLTECHDGVVHSNQFSFNSSLGIGMYRCSRNRILHNRLDFNVRGHSEGVYNRGQDSAAILIYEQSSENVFAWNSATHSGDGFFLWAGQSTMDSGKGGCNDNLLYQNDFSYAPTNGIEITFSRNKVVGNTLRGCWHGIWGGYSYDTLILANEFGDSEDGVSIEHGQNNRIDNNLFDGCETAIRLFERGAPDDWGYAKARDTDSQHYTISQNEFIGNTTAVFARDTTDIRGFGNTFKNVETEFDIEGSEFTQRTPTSDAAADHQEQLKAFRPTDISGVKLPPRLSDHPPARDSIRVSQWGPYDYRRPILWPDVNNDPSGLTLLAFGPQGKWEVVKSNGATPSWKTGPDQTQLPSGLTLAGEPGQVKDLQVKFRWTGDTDIVDEFGRTIAAGQPYEWTYSRFVAPIDWSLKFYTYDDASEPRTQPQAFAERLGGEPIATLDTDQLNLSGDQPWAPGVPGGRFAIAAEGRLQAPPGNYLLDVTSDDGIRLWLDDKLIHEDWTHHAPRTEQLPVKLDGEHTLRLEYFQIDGHAALRVELKRP